MNCVSYIGFGAIFIGDLNFAVISITGGILANWRLIVQFLCQIGLDETFDARSSIWVFRVLVCGKIQTVIVKKEKTASR